ncbi:E3 ubiquitin-protein ligase rfwd3.S-like [Amphiura filiformis]|uniref:E3 ubiquitin-protein ligase rfwd3.S-like n=1 Tax=Amphiura filiformis TaxID=82378 RepID=UPI003B214C74
MSSDSETLFDSGSETELEIDDDSDEEPELVVLPAAAANEPDSDGSSEFDDSGSTVLLLSSNDTDIELEDITDDETNTNRQNNVQRESTNESTGIGDEGAGPSHRSQSETREVSQVPRTTQSERTFHVNEGAGPSHVFTDNQSHSMSEMSRTSQSERILDEGAGPSHISASSSQRNQPHHSDLYHRIESSNQSQSLNVGTSQSGAVAIQRILSGNQAGLSSELISQSESRPSSSTNQPTNQSRPSSSTNQPTNQDTDERVETEEEDPMEAEVLTLEAPSRNDSLQDFKSPAKKSTNKGDGDKDEGGSDDDAETCIICYEPWTNSGIHRLASLRCGHLFGQSCIEKWLKGQGGKCPQCNSKAKKADIRVIYAKTLRTIDTTDRDRALKDLEKEKTMRRKMELEAAQMSLKYRMAMEEVDRMKAQLRVQQERAKTQSSFTFGSSSQPSTSSSSASAKENKGTSQGQYVLDKPIMISQNGGCRVMSFDGANYSLIVSMPSPNQLFPGFGVKKVSAMDLRSAQYVPIHSKMIRDVTFNGRHDGLMLTASVDKTIKITSLTSNTVVQTYQTEVPAWCCTWNTDDVNYIYAGLQNGTIRIIYDTRQTAMELETLNKDGSRCPIVSLNYVPAAPGTSFCSSGLLSGTLEGTTFWEKMAAAEYRPQKQLDGNCTCLNFDVSTRHCLASFRPNKAHPATRHVMCELKSNQLGGEGALVTCNAVQTLYGGTTMKLLTKSALYNGPGGNGQLLVAAGDEASCSAFVWDANTGIKTQKLSVNAAVLDVCPFTFNRHHYLACLTEKQVKLYRWQGQA